MISVTAAHADHIQGWVSNHAQSSGHRNDECLEEHPTCEAVSNHAQSSGHRNNGSSVMSAKPPTVSNHAQSSGHRNKNRGSLAFQKAVSNHAQSSGHRNLLSVQLLRVRVSRQQPRPIERA